MAVTFTKVRWKNFFATGNAWNEIDLSAYRTTLITGSNGAGKSTMLEAIFFALFNKPFRNINKSQILNSINQKNCVVEIEFTTNGSFYKVVRGIKPNIFEIYCNGNLITQDAASKDYQKILEEQIVKYNAKTFTQVVILGSASFIPFMQLPAAHRREVFDDVLDIGIFTRMNTILKQQYKDNKEGIARKEGDITRKEDNITAQERLIMFIEQTKEKEIQEKEQEIVELMSSLDGNTKKTEGLLVNINAMKEKLSPFVETKEKFDKANMMLSRTKSINEDLRSKVNFFESNDTCPECSQEINHEHKQNIVGNANKTLAENTTKTQILEDAKSKLKASILEMTEVQEDLHSLNIELSSVNTSIQQNTARINSLRNKIQEIQNQSSDVQVEKDKLDVMKVELTDLKKDKSELLDEKAVMEQAVMLLKDTGIKTSIIREYLPIMNNLINKYLSEMDFFVNFEIDESFAEVIKSRNRDEFSYSSFSEGEKQRIDLAIMFTFRKIAQMKNSLNTNLLILDEIFSSSLDQAAVEFLTNMLTTQPEGTNVLVITHHPDQFIESFDKHIQFEKRNDFSVIKE